MASAMKKIFLKIFSRKRYNNQSSSAIADEIQELIDKNHITGIFIQNELGDWHLQECEYSYRKLYDSKVCLAPCVCSKIRYKRSAIKKLVAYLKKS